MKILIVDKFEPEGVDQLRRLADDVVAETGLKSDALVKRIAEYEPRILIVRSTKVTRDAIAAAKSLALIIRAGSGVDNIDVSAASEHGVSVANCPGLNAAAVAELTMGLIISLDRRIPDNVVDLRQHRWNKKKYSKALGLKGRTLGIVGAGKIGTEVAKRALAFDMNVLYFHLGRHRRMADFPQCRRTELDELLRESDIVTLHVPGGESTRKLIDAGQLALLKPSALLINTSRASVLDEEALIAALKAGRLRGAAIDVFNDEPAADALEYLGSIGETPNLYVTHHIGASTEEAQRAVADETVHIVAEYKASGRVLNCVNLSGTAASNLLVVKFRNQPGGLAFVFSQIAEANINVEEMDHVIYDGGKTACAHIRLNGAPNADVLNRIRSGHSNVLGVELIVG